MVIADLRELAAELGVGDTKGMRKGDLIAAIRERQGKTPRKRTAAAATAAEGTLPFDGVPAAEQPSAAAVPAPAKKQEKPVEKLAEQPTERAADSTSQAEAPERPNEETQQGEDGARREAGSRRRRGAGRAAASPDAGAPQRGGD